jgi:hypothetical protein
MKLSNIVITLLTILVVSASPVLASDTIKVGAILAVTGPASNLGAPEAKTLEMMVAKINKEGGIKGKKIELILKNSDSSPEKAFSLAKQLIEGDKVMAIIGPSTSGETMKIKNLAEESKTILLSCAAAEAIVNPVAKYVFKVPQKDSYAVIMIFEQMKKMGPISNLVDMIPGLASVKSQLKLDQVDESFWDKAEAVVYSMTPEERRNPDIINGSRRKRIAKGSGTSPQEVNRLLNQWKEAKKMAQAVVAGKGPSLLRMLGR